MKKKKTDLIFVVKEKIGFFLVLNLFKRGKKIFG